MPRYDQSSFDPNAAPGDPRPLRPFDWVQWAGVALVVVGALSFTVYFAGRIGLIPKLLDDGMPLVAFIPLGAALISRRQGSPRDPEALKRQRILAIVLALGALVLGAGIAIFLKSQGA